ncbi:hypothetical protein JTB14_036405 [Gonioctena quinquepunctata]|nr:hypothetical protein JTB14_036405 [Gonioctena quinquepunctata]
MSGPQERVNSGKKDVDREKLEGALQRDRRTPGMPEVVTVTEILKKAQESSRLHPSISPGPTPYCWNADIEAKKNQFNSARRRLTRTRRNRDGTEDLDQEYRLLKKEHK